MKYNKPSELGTTEDLVKRFQAAKKQRSAWQSHLRECYEYALPQRNTMSSFSRGQKKNEDIYDSTAVVGTQKFASRLQATLIPPWREWSMLMPGSEIPEDEHEKIQPVLDDVTKIIFDHINHSNFSTQAHESFLDLAVSTGVMSLEESEGTGSALEFHAAPLAEIYPEAGPWGTIETVWREHKVPARHIDRLWPGAEMSESMKKKASERPDEKISLIEGTVYLPKRGYWHQCVLEEASKEYIFGQDYEVSPWIVFREYVVPGETLGRGRIMQVLPDIKTANKVVEYVLKNAALAISGVYTAADDGVINPYNIRLTRAPSSRSVAMTIPIRRCDRWTAPAIFSSVPWYWMTCASALIKHCLPSPLARLIRRYAAPPKWLCGIRSWCRIRVAPLAGCRLSSWRR